MELGTRAFGYDSKQRTSVLCAIASLHHRPASKLSFNNYRAGRQTYLDTVSLRKELRSRARTNRMLRHPRTARIQNLRSQPRISTRLGLFQSMSKYSDSCAVSAEGSFVRGGIYA